MNENHSRPTVSRAPAMLRRTANLRGVKKLPPSRRVVVKETAATIARDYTMLVIGAILYALSFILFVTPNKFAPAGVGGILTMIQYKTGTSIGYLYLLVNIPMCIVSFFAVRRKFSVRTLVFVVVYSVAYLLMQQTSFFDRFIYQADGILPAIAAGTMSGVVYAIELNVDSCTGGTDVISTAVAKFRPEYNMIWVTFLLNSAVAVVSYFVYSDFDAAGNPVYKFEPVILCIIYCLVSTRVCDWLLQGNKQALKFEVITNNATELANDIITELHHTATVISAKGMYSRGDKMMLVCVVGKRQIVQFRKILARYPDTFAYVTSVSETLGFFRKDKETMDEALKKNKIEPTDQKM